MAKKTGFVEISVDEVVGTLKRSNLPTVFVEGESDLFVYKRLGKVLGLRKLDFLSCGGRETLLKIFKRRHEFSNVKVFFLADQDLWVFEGKPEEYAEIFTTKGYCIENDLYMDGEVALHKLLDEEEVQLREELIQNVSKWFASEISKMLNNQASEAKFSKVSLLNDAVMEKGRTNFTETFLAERAFVLLDEEVNYDFYSNFKIKLSGKFIFQIYLKIFTHIRKVENEEAIIFNLGHLRELCFREGIAKNDSLINNIRETLKAHFNL